MIGRPPTVGDLLGAANRWVTERSHIRAGSRRADRFSAFGAGTVVCHPPAALFGERAIRLGEGTLIGPYVSLSAGMEPDQELVSDHIVTIGDRCLIGRSSSIVAHLEVVIEDDVFFGPNVYVTDQNHGVDRLDVPIGRQSRLEEPVRIGAGSWLGANAVVLPGVTIGRHVAVGAGSVVTGDLPDRAVAVGVPARVVRLAGPDEPDDQPGGTTAAPGP